MVELTFKSINKQPYFPNVRNSLLEIREASTIRKVKKLAQLIVFLPWLIIKDCSYLFYRRKVKQISIVDELHSAINLIKSKVLLTFNKSKNSVSKHKSEIIKVVSLGITFLVGRQLVGYQADQTNFWDRFSKKSVGAIGFILGAVSLAILKKGHEQLEMRTLKKEPVYATIVKADNLIKKIWVFKSGVEKSSASGKERSYYKFKDNKNELRNAYIEDLEIFESGKKGIDQLLAAYELSYSQQGYLYGKKGEYSNMQHLLATDYNLSNSAFPENS